MFLKTFNSEFWIIKVWFTDQNSRQVEIEDKIKIILVVNWNAKYKTWYNMQFNQETEYL